MSKQFFTTDDAAAELGINGQEVMQSALELGVGQKVGPDWVFTAEDLDILRNRPTQRHFYKQRRRLSNPSSKWLASLPLYYGDAFPIVQGIAALGLAGDVDVFVSADVAIDILIAAPIGRRILDAGGVRDPYQIGKLTVTFRSDPSLPPGTVAVDLSGKRVRLNVTRIRRN